MTTYTVFDSQDSRKAMNGLTIDEAAEAILQQDGQEYEIRNQGNFYTLWTRQQVANRPWMQTVFSAVSENEQKAKDSIFNMVLGDALGQRITWMIDEDYNLMLAKIAKDNDE